MRISALSSSGRTSRHAKLFARRGQLSMLSASAKEFTPFGGGGNSGLFSRDDDDNRETFVGDVSDYDEGVDVTSCDGVEGGLGLYAQVQLEAELLEIMAESFSEFSPECLQVALAKSNWDLDRASEGLLSALQASDPEWTSKPCRHLLLGGECLRSDCAFSHDFSLTTCRFWLYGRCLHSRDECAFRHDLDVPIQGTKQNIPEAPEGEPDYDRDHFDGDSSRRGRGVFEEDSNFPSLPLKSPAPYAGWDASVRSIEKDKDKVKYKEAEESGDWGGRKDVLLEAVLPTPDHKQGNSGRRGAKGRRKKTFTYPNDPYMSASNPPQISREIADYAPVPHGHAPALWLEAQTRFTAVNIQALMRGNSSSDTDAHTTNVERNDGIGQAPMTATKPAAWRSATGEASFAAVVGSTTKPIGVVAPEAIKRRGACEVKEGRNSGSSAIQESRGTWVSTGDAVALQYEGARKEAAELARARNKLFTSATEAFRRGQGRVARDLARRGRKLNAEMKEKHRQAASAIFAARNPRDQVFERKTIDLHALHIREALEVLHREMEALAERNVDKVRVLAGTGHHSKGPTSKARLIPAVETFCQSRGLSYRLVADHGTAHVGIVEVHLAGLSLYPDTPMPR